MKKLTAVLICILLILSFSEKNVSAYAENYFIHNTAEVYMDFEENIPGITRFSGQLGKVAVYGGNVGGLMSVYRVRSVTYSINPADAEKIISDLHAEVLCIQHLDGVTMYYCQSAYISSVIKTDIGSVNIQIAVSKDYALAGIPVIMGCA